MKIGILREEKSPVDNRAPLTPIQCQQLQEQYQSISLFVQSSNVRCFKDADYQNLGIKLVDDISNCDVLLGIKEVPIANLIPNKTYFFFSHTIKKQEYNRGLLQAMVAKNIEMIDYEVIRNAKGKRLLGFGRYAGIIGAYNGLLTYGLKSEKYQLKAAHLCEDRAAMESELEKLKLNNEKIVLTGSGRVGQGALETLRKANIKEVSKDEFLNSTFNEAVFTQLNTEDYNARIDGTAFNKFEFYNQPEFYISTFKQYAKEADIFIAGHYYSDGAPYFITKKDAKSDKFNLSVIADISCDINGPIASTIRASTIENPIYGYNPNTETGDDFMAEGNIAVMAVDNLPSELPKDASEDFGSNLLEKIFPILVQEDNEGILAKATICKNGNLTTNFEYLRDYLNGL